MFDFFLLAVQVVDASIYVSISISVLGEGLYAKIEPNVMMVHVKCTATWDLFKVFQILCT